MRRLEHWIDQISFHIKELDPKCLIHVTKDTYEGEDAYIHVKSNLDQMDLMRKVTPLQGEAILDDWFIPVLVTEMD
jgi:hypothetical protein